MIEIRSNGCCHNLQELTKSWVDRELFLNSISNDMFGNMASRRIDVDVW